MLILPKDRNIHRPAHLYLPDHHYYFITSRTCEEILYFYDNLRKKIPYSVILEGIKRFEMDLFAWVVICNHYHFIVKAKEPKLISELVGFINGKSSNLLNKFDNKTGRTIWYQYWDEIIDSEEKFWPVVNYIHQNPIKHGLAKDFSEVANYPFCSYKSYLKKFGQEFMDQVWGNYPINSYLKE